ncbi:unnamed protein product [Scytosiphon promiscuus]
MGIEGTEGEEEFFRRGCKDTNIKLQPYQRAQTQLSTGVGGLGLSSAVTRSGHAKVLSFFGESAVIASPNRPLGESVKAKIPSTTLVARMGDAIMELNQEHGLTEEVLREILTPSWVRGQ